MELPDGNINSEAQGSPSRLEAFDRKLAEGHPLSGTDFFVDPKASRQQLWSRWRGLWWPNLPFDAHGRSKGLWYSEE